MAVQPRLLVDQAGGHRHLAAGERDGAEIADRGNDLGQRLHRHRSEEHTSELQSLMRISYAVFCLNKKKSSLSAARISDNATFYSDLNHTRITSTQYINVRLSSTYR